jgi:hypothetical protein
MSKKFELQPLDFLADIAGASEIAAVSPGTVVSVITSAVIRVTRAMVFLDEQF